MPPIKSEDRLFMPTQILNDGFTTSFIKRTGARVHRFTHLLIHLQHYASVPRLFTTTHTSCHQKQPLLKNKCLSPLFWYTNKWVSLAVVPKDWWLSSTFTKKKRPAQRKEKPRERKRERLLFIKVLPQCFSTDFALEIKWWSNTVPD